MSVQPLGRFITPFSRRKYETFSYLPALKDQEISRQVDYITRNGWVPCLEFAEAAQGYVNSENCERMGSVSAGYYDNRYWTLWKLPMFGCSDPGQVLAEVQNCRKVLGL
jgi:ribulose-bisphosphate carboxylase small chain